MVEEVWFMRRMMNDEWSFGLLTSNDTVICISRINGIHEPWIDVDLLPHDEHINAVLRKWGLHPVFALTSRLTCSVRLDTIVAAFELADT
jgi:hypothetical protein